MKKMILVVLVIFMLSMSACSPKIARPEEGCKWFETTNACLDRLNGDIPVSWKDAVVYAQDGSGPEDPSTDFETDQTAVDHANRLIVENAKLDVRACFPSINDEDWRNVADWANQWGSDSPTRIEWQVNESRCSWVFPGNITDPIGQDDYEELLVILTEAGLTDTWFVAGEEGQEFGRVTYEEIVSVDRTFNRLHVYGPQLATMPVSTK